MEMQVQEILPKLSAAVEAMMNPVTPQAQRLEAYQACEDFKETSPVCAHCGMVMSGKQNPPVIRHFGLQLLEHCVKYRWYSMTQDDKVFIKENTMKLMLEGTHDLLAEHAHIKDAVSRIVVEMMKREWPQQWPSLMQELDQLCKHGATQTELVLLVFLRLAEDIVAFQNVPAKRRREMLQALNTHMPEIFSFFVNTLQDNQRQYEDKKGSADALLKTEAGYHSRIAQAVMQTLTGYLDWVVMSVVMDRGGLLLQLLCHMLSDEQLQLHSAECLLLITSRKGKAEDRKPILILFSKDAMFTIVQAAIAAAAAALDSYHYLFLKKLCQVLTAIGSQLCALWGTSEGVQRPENFEDYLKAIMAFTHHPSQMLGSFTQSLWAAFVRHEHISHDPVLISFIPNIAEAAKSAFLKVGFPSQYNSPSCGYSRIEFDSDEDFNHFYSKYRAEVAETIRLVTQLCPTVPFGIVASWLNERLGKVVDVGEGHDRDHCNLSSPAFLEWDALTVYLESVMSRLNVSDQPKPPIEEGIKLFKAVLSFDTQDPLILSCVLSCISALFPYITHAPETLATVLDKIFNTAVFTLHGQTKATRSRAVKNVRRHACSVLVKMCKQYPQLLLPAFEQLYSHIQKLGSDPEELSQMEKGTLMEALILISNEFRNFEKQCNFIAEILTPVKEMWLSQDFKEALWSVDKFITYIGADQAPVEPSSADTCGINRSHMTYCVNTILAALKRSKWPEDMQEAKNGGFVMTTPDGRVVLRNPATPHISLMLENVLHLLRTLNALWLPENLAKRHPDFSQAYEPVEVEKLAILGIQPPCIDNTDAPANKHPLARMQNFISTAHDNCYHLLGNAGFCLGNDFYSLPNLAQALLNSVFTNLEHIPNYRLRPILRVFLKPYILSCPKEFHSVVVIPILSLLCPFMLQRLANKWNSIAQRLESRSQDDNNDDENQESAEILEDQLACLLTREYMELLSAVCCNKRGSLAPSTDGVDEVMMEDADSAPVQSGGPKDDSLSELGQLALATESVFPSLILSVFSGLKWADSTTCNKCTTLAWPLLKHIVHEKQMGSEDVCHLFSDILLGLQQHGQHEGNQVALLSLGIQAYELLRREFPDVKEVMRQIPNIKENELKAFDEKLLNACPQKLLPEKRKRETFKKLVEEIIGKNIGQQFKKEMQIKDLPPMMKRIREKMPPLDESESKDIGLCKLFVPDATQSMAQT